MHTCTKVFHEIPFAHRQHNHHGHCAFIHGHNWTIEVTFKSGMLDECGFVVDFGKLGFLKEWIEKYLDHALLINRNDPYKQWFMDELGTGKLLAKIAVVPDGSAEGLAKYFFEVWGPMVRNRDVEFPNKPYISSITVREDSNNSATYTPL